jgi:UPF0755 protein
MNRLKAILLATAAALALGAGAFWISLSQPYAGFKGEVFVDIPRGTSARGMADMLESAGVVPHSWQFLAARALNPHRRLQAGEYRFAHPANVWEVFHRIARGDIFYYTLTIPEGQNLFEIGAALAGLNIPAAAGFPAAARNPALIRGLDPRASSLEGYLFPDSYRIGRHQDASAVCRMMTDRFRQVWKSLGSPGNVHDVVTLASMVEKEAAVAEERPVIAGVFENRLKIGMKLDCDPTTVYAAILAGTWTGVIHRSELDSGHPYNTYRNSGLPPGPIANPGLASLKAALDPARTDYLYFVLRTDGSGRHEFSRDMESHQVAAARYRRANGGHEHAKDQPKAAAQGVRRGPRTRGR